MENKLKNISISLGQAFALIQYEKEKGSLKEVNLSKVEKDELIILKEISEQILNDNNNSFQNEDTILHNLVFRAFMKNDTEEEKFVKLESINSSFKLFEKFNQVFMDFILKSGPYWQH